jgi:hypothetical protein
VADKPSVRAESQLLQNKKQISSRKLLLFRKPRQKNKTAPEMDQKSGPGSAVMV